MYVGQSCSGCVTYSVFQNVNSCFTGNQWQAGGTTYASNPTTTACNTSQNLVSQGYNTCSACTTYAVFRDTAVCSSTYNMYFVNGVNVGFSAPVSGACFYGQNIEYQGYTTCLFGNLYGVFRDLNECSGTYLHYFVDGQDLGTSAPPSQTNCSSCEEISVSNYSDFEVYIEWLPCTASSNTSYYLQVGETIYFCRNTNASFNTGGLGYSVGATCSYNGYSINIQ
jgi:hypothetical protein